MLDKISHVHDLEHTGEHGCACDACAAECADDSNGDHSARVDIGSFIEIEGPDFEWVSPDAGPSKPGTYNPASTLSQTLSAALGDGTYDGHSDHDHDHHDDDHDGDTLSELQEQQATGVSVPGYETGTNDADQPIDGLIYGIKWGTTDLTYSFVKNANDYESAFASSALITGTSELTQNGKNAIVATFQEFSAISDLNFSQLTQNSQNGASGQRIIDADLRVAQTSSISTAAAYLPSTNAIGGDSFFRTNSYTNPEIGNYQYHTYLHEIGHALGLKHGHETGGAGAIPYEFDSMEFSVMTYRAYVGKSLDYGYTAESWGYAQSLMMLDIAAIQRLYGADFETNSGDTTYSFSTSTGEMFVDGVGVGTPGGNRVFRTLWDGNGQDTYDFSNYTKSLAVDLSPGGHTELDANGNAQRAKLEFGYNGADVVYARGHVFNAMQYEDDVRSLIENAIGGSGNDSFKGNAADNRLEGRGGNDSFEDSAGDDTYLGGNGTDTVYFGGSFGDYAFELADTFLKVIDAAVDWVENTIEWLSFSNTNYSFDEIVDGLVPVVNADPVAQADAFVVTEDAVSNFDLVSNDTDGDNDTLSISAINGQAISVGQTIMLVSGASLTLLANGTMEYDQNRAFENLNAGQTASDSFTYRVTDGQSTDTATATVTVSGVTDNIAPQAVNDTATAGGNGSITANVLSNDSDADGGTLSVTKVNGETLGSTITLASGALVTMASNGTYTYQRNGAFSDLVMGETATDSFIYALSDGAGGTDTATVNVTLNGTRPPVVENALSIDFETMPDGDYLGQDGLDVTGISTVSTGKISGSKAGFIAKGVSAEISFSGGTFDLNEITFTSAGGRGVVVVRSYDENGTQLHRAKLVVDTSRDKYRNYETQFDDVAKITITGQRKILIDNIEIVTRVEGDAQNGNIGPVAVNDLLSVTEGQDLVADLFADNGFGADYDSDADELQLLSIEGNDSGTVTLASGASVDFDADGTFVYAQNDAFDTLYAGMVGADEFEYTVSDGNGGFDTGTLQIAIDGEGRAPIRTKIVFNTDPIEDGFVFEDITIRKRRGDLEARSDGKTVTVTRADGEDFAFDWLNIRSPGKINGVVATINGYDDGVLVASEDKWVWGSGKNRKWNLTDESFDRIDTLEITAPLGVIIDDLVFTY